MELRTEADFDGNYPMQIEQTATLSGRGWSVPVSIRAISISTSAANDREARRILEAPATSSTTTPKNGQPSS